MSSATETAMLALKAALDANADLPAVRRDAAFAQLMEDMGGADGLARALVLRIGNDVSDRGRDRAIGASNEKFEITRQADVEVFVAGPEGGALNAAFDDAIVAVFETVEADPTLGGAVVSAEVSEPPEIDVDEAGARAVLTALIRVDLLFVSPRAY